MSNMNKGLSTTSLMGRSQSVQMPLCQQRMPLCQKHPNTHTHLLPCSAIVPSTPCTCHSRNPSLHRELNTKTDKQRGFGTQAAFWRNIEGPGKWNKTHLNQWNPAMFNQTTVKRTNETLEDSTLDFDLQGPRRGNSHSKLGQGLRRRLLHRELNGHHLRIRERWVRGVRNG